MSSSRITSPHSSDGLLQETGDTLTDLIADGLVYRNIDADRPSTAEDDHRRLYELESSQGDIAVHEVPDTVSELNESTVRRTLSLRLNSASDADDDGLTEEEDAQPVKVGSADDPLTMCPEIARFPLRRFEDLEVQESGSGGVSIRDVVRAV